MKYRKKPVPPGHVLWPGPIPEVEILIAGPHHPDKRHGAKNCHCSKTCKCGIDDDFIPAGD